MISAFWEMFKPLYAVYTLEGYTENEIAYLKELFGALPRVLEDYYRAAGRTKAFHCVQDTWMLPEHFQKWEWLREPDYLILLNENQGVCAPESAGSEIPASVIIAALPASTRCPSRTAFTPRASTISNRSGCGSGSLELFR